MCQVSLSWLLQILLYCHRHQEGGQARQQTGLPGCPLSRERWPGALGSAGAPGHAWVQAQARRQGTLHAQVQPQALAHLWERVHFSRKQVPQPSKVKDRWSNLKVPCTRDFIMEGSDSHCTGQLAAEAGTQSTSLTRKGKESQVRVIRKRLSCLGEEEGSELSPCGTVLPDRLGTRQGS